MYTKKQTVYIKAITPIHAGTGQALTTVDMPIQRERHSNIPKIEGSSLKGAIKHHIYKKLELNKEENSNEKNELYNIFGPDKGDEKASTIGFTDARLLLFPMRSVTDIFKLITCPYVLRRWIEDSDINMELKLKVEDGQYLPLVDVEDNENIILEEYVFDIATIVDSALDNIKGQLEKINGIKDQLDRIVILSDSDFVDMVTMYTEVITRNKINVETGTAEGTGLFNEEYLPSETILYFNVLEAPFFNDTDKDSNKTGAIDYFNDKIGNTFQVGGNETIGKGIVKIGGAIKNYE